MWILACSAKFVLPLFKDGSVSESDEPIPKTKVVDLYKKKTRPHSRRMSNRIRSNFLITYKIDADLTLAFLFFICDAFRSLLNFSTVCKDWATARLVVADAVAAVYLVNLAALLAIPRLVIPF
jgi:hypothetical protein